MTTEDWELRTMTTEGEIDSGDTEVPQFEGGLRVSELANEGGGRGEAPQLLYLSKVKPQITT